MNERIRSGGFTLVEVLVVIGILAVVGALAIMGYQEYINRAKAAEVISKFDELRTKTLVRLATSRFKGDQPCDAWARTLNARRPVSSAHVNLAYSFEAVTDKGGATVGYRPVLGVCATADSPFSVGVAKAAHDKFVTMGVVEKNAQLSSTLVSFALRLTEPDAVVCKTAPSPVDTCKAAPVQVVTAPPSQPPQRAAVSTAPPAAGIEPPATPRPTPREPATTPPAATTTQVTMGPPPLRGKQCLVCGDLDNQIPCNDMELVIGQLTQCDDSSPICETRVDFDPDYKQYRTCSSEATVAAHVKESMSKPECQPQKVEAYANGADQIDSATCYFACYGDGCNADSPWVQDSGTKVSVEGGVTVVAGQRRVSTTVTVAQAPIPNPAAPRCAGVPKPPTQPRNPMTFAGALTGAVMNNGDLSTGGDLRQFTVEVAVVGGGQQVAAAGGHGATIFSYATRTQTNAFVLWNPNSLTVEFNNVDYDTGLNVNDGKDHRITTTWDSRSGLLIVYDNGQPVWRGGVNQGGTLGGGGKMVLGQDQDSYGGGFAKEDAYQGQIMAASLASGAAPASQVAGGPVHTSYSPTNGLIANVVMDRNGRPIDTTGRHTFASTGAVSGPQQAISTDLYVTADCK